MARLHVWLKAVSSWFRGWTRRLSGQLVVSHVFVAALVLSFAFGAAQITFRHYLAQNQLSGLSSQAETLQGLVVQPYFEGSLFENQAIDYMRVLQGGTSNRIYVYDHFGNLLLQTHNGKVPSVVPSNQVLALVMDGGHTYSDIIRGVAVVGIPVYLGPNNIAGALFLESPLSVSSRTANSLSWLLLFDEVAAIVLVGVLAYVISSRLSQPLEQLRQVVAGTGRAHDASIRRAPEDQGPAEVQALAHEFNRLEDRIGTQMDQLKREAEARDALMAHVAHDLRTPLTSIRGFLEAVQDGVATGAAHDRAVTVAWEETLRLQRLVDRLLKATRIRSEGGPMALLATSQWVSKTLDRLSPLLEREQVTLRWEVREDGVVWGNEDYLVEALMNVLDNAMKWSPAGSVIEVGTELRGDRIVVWVKDEGPGIPEELLPRVFERFVTGDSSRQYSSGLGLFIVDEVARQHGGEVSIHSKSGEGTVVELSLPLAAEDSS